MAFRRRAGLIIIHTGLPLDGAATATFAIAAGLAFLLASAAPPVEVKAGNRKLMREDYVYYDGNGAGYGPTTYGDYGGDYTTTPTTTPGGDYNLPESPPAPPAAPPGPGAGGGGDYGGGIDYGDCADADTVLYVHNLYRSTHGAPALSWNDELASDAQSWADDLAMEDCTVRYSGTTQGENIYEGSPGTVTNLICANAVRYWYNEESNYMFSYSPWSDNQDKDVLHFTQVIWRDTREVGCGAAAGNGGSCYVVVCRYWPPGNVENDDEFLLNVKPPE